MCDKRDIIHTHIVLTHTPGNTKYYHIYCNKRKIWQSPKDAKERKLVFQEDWWFAKDTLKNDEGIFINCRRKGCYNKFIKLPKTHYQQKELRMEIKMKSPKKRDFYKSNHFDNYSVL